MQHPGQFHERLRAIQDHLTTGGKVMVVTYAKSTIYDRRHLDSFSANDTGLYVRRGRTKDCLNFTPIRFSRQP